MKNAKVVMIYYFNQDHSEVDRRLSLDILKEGGLLERLVQIHDANETPFVYSAQGLDICLLNELNPRLLEEIKKNPYISLTKGLMTHVIPTRQSSRLLDNIKWGNFSFNHFFADKVSDVAMLPEFDMDPRDIANYQDAGYRYILLQDILNPAYDYRDNINGTLIPVDDNLIVIDNGFRKINGIVTNGTLLRTAFLRMLRGVISASDSAKVFEDESKKAYLRNHPISPFLIDAESILINYARLDDGYVNDPLDKLNEFQRYLKDIGCAAFDKKTLDDICSHYADAKRIKLDIRQKPKWIIEGDSLENSVDNRLINLKDFSGKRPKNVSYETLDQKAKLWAMWAAISDYYSAQFGIGKVIRLPVFDEQGREYENAVTIRSDEKRLQEVLSAINVVERRTKFFEGLEYYSKVYLNMLDEVFEKLVRLNKNKF